VPLPPINPIPTEKGIQPLPVPELYDHSMYIISTYRTAEKSDRQQKRAKGSFLPDIRAQQRHSDDDSPTYLLFCFFFCELLALMSSENSVMFSPN